MDRGASPPGCVGAVRAEILALPVAVSLLTRLALPGGRAGRPLQDRQITRSAVWFPLVGAAIGLMVAAVAAAGALWLPVPVAVAVAVGAETWLTGALHLDGLADSADGLAGRDREHALAIMRDHSVGVYGAAVIGLSLLLKTTALSALLSGGASHAVPLVLGAYALSRAAPLPLAWLLDYPRSDGTGRAVILGLRARRAAVGVCLAVVLSAVAGWTAVVMAGAVTLTTSAVGLTAYRRIGGATGDVLGASIEVALLAALVLATGAR